ncbi:dapper homolog 3 [Periophthalmus magnuspinnatus]|uniref:dapper homolog 3 n=1 Tax=Periophthalmus magnuspinnatus TaxID=409849 RepID=UPI00145BE68C|nr:dapper homolog 3 [Periophthalmus magnuspinnatus]
MHRAFTFPMTVERSRTKECLEASLAGLCELELRKQKQESLVLGALALGDPILLQRDQGAGGAEACFSIWGQENLTLRRQLSALQSHPWALLQSLEQQVGELRIDTDAAGDGSDSRPSSGFYESSEGHSPKGRCCTEPTETQSTWTYSNDRPKSVGDSLSPNIDIPILHTTLPRSFSAPYPPLEGIAEEGCGPDPWFWDPPKTTHTWPQHQQQEEEMEAAKEEDYQQAMRVEGYILSVIQRHTLSPRPCQPRTTISPDPTYSSTSLHRRTPSLTSESRPLDPYLQPYVDLLGHPSSQIRGCDLYEGEACGGEAPSLEEDCFLALPYPQSRPHSLTGRLPSPLPFLDPNCGAGALDLCGELTSPQHFRNPQPPIHQNLVNAQFVPGQGGHAAIQSPRHYIPCQSKQRIQTITSPEHQNKAKASKKNHNERQKAKKSNGKNRSQSENSLIGQGMLPERRYSTTERPQGRADPAYNQAIQMGRNNGNRRWCSNLELSQDEGESHTPQASRRPPRKRNGHSYQQQQSHTYYQQHRQQWQHSDYHQRAPLCQEEAYPRAIPAESESSMSEVYSPGSSSISSDSDESGGLVWPQQLPPRLAMGSSSSSSPSPQANAAVNGNASQPKAFVKIKASHALKKKILRFRSGSLKVMTTV